MPVGTVRKLENDYALVTIERQDMCGECHACEMLGETKKCEIRCINRAQADVNDQVEIDLAKPTFLKASFIMYGVPLVGLLAGLLLGTLLPLSLGTHIRELGMIVCGIGLMTLGFVWIRKRDQAKHYTDLLPVIIEVLTDKN